MPPVSGSLAKLSASMAELWGGGASPEFSPQQAAVPLPSSKVITISPPSR